MTNFWTIVGAILVAQSIWFAIFASALAFKKVRTKIMKFVCRIDEEFTDIERLEP